MLGSSLSDEDEMLDLVSPLMLQYLILEVSKEVLSSYLLLLGLT
jgi:hypothetical protein